MDNMSDEIYQELFKFLGLKYHMKFEWDKKIFFQDVLCYTKCILSLIEHYNENSYNFFIYKEKVYERVNDVVVNKIHKISKNNFLEESIKEIEKFISPDQIDCARYYLRNSEGLLCTNLVFKNKLDSIYFKLFS